MKYEVNEVKTVCTFDELSDTAKMRVVDEVYEWDFEWDMKCYMELDVDPHFSTEVEVQYDFSCSQGSGLNLYGTFDLSELMKYALEYWDERTEGETWKHAANHWHTYSTWGFRDTMLDLQEAYENCGIPENEALEIADAVCGAMDGLCSKLYDEGERCIEWYGNPEYHEGKLYYENGAFWGDECDYQMMKTA